ncbi:fimbria/pilus periplasmic chaperone [Escherichia coli]
MITPPIFRMDSKSGQTVRIVYTGESLPKDRESLFYLNVLDIPAKPRAKKTPITQSSGIIIICN